MANSKKSFSLRETWLAKIYIKRKFLLDPDWPQYDDAYQNKALEAFNELGPDDKEDEIWGWCETWLNPGQRKQLLEALRAKRKREKDSVPKKNITLDHKAWSILSKLAKRDNVTISQFLIARFEREYLDLDEFEI